MEKTYGVINGRGEWFGGFDDGGVALWVSGKMEAVAFGSKLDAECQARLFASRGLLVQKKPALLV